MANSSAGTPCICPAPHGPGSAAAILSFQRLYLPLSVTRRRKVVFGHMMLCLLQLYRVRGAAVPRWKTKVELVVGSSELKVFGLFTHHCPIKTALRQRQVRLKSWLCRAFCIHTCPNICVRCDVDMDWCEPTSSHTMCALPIHLWLAINSGRPAPVTGAGRALINGRNPFRMRSSMPRCFTRQCAS